MNLKISKATESDAEVIALLGRITFDDSMGDLFVDKEELLNYYEKEFSLEKTVLSIKDSNNIYWIARYNGVPVGYLKLKMDSKIGFSTSKNISEINRVFVLKDYLSKGVGNQLHQVLMEEIENMSTEVLWIRILEDNVPAQNFYTKQGFQKKINQLYSVSRYDLKFEIFLKEVK
ncbi:MAG: GNAT family N-acetyltransferase [Flavobacteriales bacterium]|nr:GNAT family N-acetyltransferase [Flavobacteriales bacterium]